MTNPTSPEDLPVCVAPACGQPAPMEFGAASWRTYPYLDRIVRRLLTTKPIPRERHAG